MDLARCDECGNWHLTLTDRDLIALAFVADDWSEATANAEEEGDLDTPAEVRLWQHAQRLCGTFVGAAVQLTIDQHDEYGNPNGTVH